MRRTALAIVTVALAAGLGCTKTARDEPAQSSAVSAAAPVTLTVTSAAFADGAAIPQRFTCDGNDLSPPLAWSAPPAGTKSFAVVLEDPDAPDPDSPNRRTFVHWIVYGLAPQTRALPEAMPLAAGARVGVNDFGKVGYGGPCPPKGQHRYVFKVYALDDELADLRTPRVAELDRAMDGHVLAKGRLVAVYERTTI